MDVEYEVTFTVLDGDVEIIGEKQWRFRSEFISRREIIRSALKSFGPHREFYTSSRHTRFTSLRVLHVELRWVLANVMGITYQSLKIGNER